MKSILFILFFLITKTASYAQLMKGVICDKQKNTPLANANIWSNTSNSITNSNLNGQFT